MNPEKLLDELQPKAPEMEEALEETQVPIDYAAQAPMENGRVDLVQLIHQPAWKTILIDLVKSNKMDPWNIDIAALANQYLAAVQKLDGNDLRLPANAILCSALLLKFKARVLKLSSIEELDPEEEALLQKQELLAAEEKKYFDEYFPDLKLEHKVREGKVSLDALVDLIEGMLEKTKKGGSDQRLIERPDFKIPVSDYNLDKKMAELFKLIQKTVDETGLTLFSRVVSGKEIVQIVDSFIPLLFLANKQKVNIWQDDFFGEIFIALNKEKAAA